MKLKNRYFLLRHGETTHQIEKEGIIYFWPEDKPPATLTSRGREQIAKVAKKLKNPQEKIDLIFSSDTLRTRQTAEIVANELEGLKIHPVKSSKTGVSKGQFNRVHPVKCRFAAILPPAKLFNRVNLDSRLRDVNLGVFQGKPKEEFYQVFPKGSMIRFLKKPKEGESWNDVKKRLNSFLKDIEKKYKNKTILVVGHGEPLWLLSGIVRGLTNEELIKEKNEKGTPKLAELRKL